jgi:hypothetical protein
MKIRATVGEQGKRCKGLRVGTRKARSSGGLLLKAEKLLVDRAK